MKYIFYFFLLIQLVSCSKNEVNPQETGKLQVSKAINTNGEITYSYDADHLLIRYSSSLGGIDTKFFYENQQLKTIEYLPRNIRTRSLVKDSIIYDTLNRIDSIFKFWVKPDYPTTIQVEKFIYDDMNQVIKRQSYTENGQLSSTTEYTWEEGNIGHTKSYDPSNYYQKEVTYTFDQKINYFQYLPTALSWAGYYNKNNITSKTITSSNRISGCYHCITKYKYNSRNYPIQIEDALGYITALEYE